MDDDPSPRPEALYSGREAADLTMARYPALIDGEKGTYGVTFPDLPGIVAMGAPRSTKCS